MGRFICLGCLRRSDEPMVVLPFLVLLALNLTGITKLALTIARMPATCKPLRPLAWFALSKSERSLIQTAATAKSQGDPQK